MVKKNLNLARLPIPPRGPENQELTIAKLIACNFAPHRCTPQLQTDQKWKGILLKNWHKTSQFSNRCYWP